MLLYTLEPRREYKNMKKKMVCIVLAFLMIVFLVNPVPGHAGGGGHYRGGYHGWGHGDWWLPLAILGGVAFIASIYSRPQYEAVATPEQSTVYTQPPQAAAPSTAEKYFAYPRWGQSDELQAKDRYECHSWAVSQTHYDPTQYTAGTSESQLNQMRADYQRAMAACLDGRGYTMR